MQTGKEIDFEKICKTMYDVCRKYGSPGIGAVGDVGNEWIFVEASSYEGEINYDASPMFVDKATGMIRTMDFTMKEDREKYYSAKPVEFSNRYKA